MVSIIFYPFSQVGFLPRSQTSIMTRYVLSSQQVQCNSFVESMPVKTNRHAQRTNGTISGIHVGGAILPISKVLSMQDSLSNHCLETFRTPLGPVAGMAREIFRGAEGLGDSHEGRAGLQPSSLELFSGINEILVLHPQDFEETP